MKRGQDETKVGFNVSFVSAAANASISGGVGGAGNLEASGRQQRRFVHTAIYSSSTSPG